MEKQKRFKKQELKRADYKNMEQGAKVLKRGLGICGSLWLIVKNKDKLQAIGKGVVNLAEKAIK